MTDLTFARVVDDAAAALALLLDRELTGYAVFTPQDALLLDVDGEGVVALEAGVPTHARYTGTDRGGAAALADLATTGPLRVECYEDDTAPVPETGEYAIAPETPAERLAGDDDLAARTRSAADAVGVTAPTHSEQGTGDNLGAVEEFLADEQKVQAIQERAREEARQRAEEWDFDDVDTS